MVLFYSSATPEGKPVVIYAGRDKVSSFLNPTDQANPNATQVESALAPSSPSFNR